MQCKWGVRVKVISSQIHKASGLWFLQDHVRGISVFSMTITQGLVYSQASRSLFSFHESRAYHFRREEVTYRRNISLWWQSPDIKIHPEHGNGWNDSRFTCACGVLAGNCRLLGQLNVVWTPRREIGLPTLHDTGKGSERPNLRGVQKRVSK